MISPSTSHRLSLELLSWPAWARDILRASNSERMIPPDKHLQIGSLAFDDLDQIDLTGPFEVLARLPNSTHRIFAKTAAPVRDMQGLKLLPDAVLTDAPRLDVLHIPGGFGQEALMEDEDVLGWIRLSLTS